MVNKKQLTTLTALKGLFCLVIAIHNTLQVHFLFDDIPGTSFIHTFGGTLGNSVFFMISGFLFAYNYREQIQLHQVPFSGFLLRRLRKLYPLYLLTNSVALLASIVQHGLSVIDLSRIASILLLQSFWPYNSPTWFLSALFTCYLLFYFITYHSKNSTQYYCAVALCILLGFTRGLDIPFWGSKNCFGYLNFFLGCVLADVYPLVLKRNCRWLHHACLGLLGCLFCLLLKFGVEIICGDVELAFSCLLSPLILYIALADGIYAKILRLPLLVSLGQISTSVYFWHMPVYIIFCGLFTRGDINEKQYLLYLAIIMTVSIISYRVFECRRQRQPAKAR